MPKSKTFTAICRAKRMPAASLAMLGLPVDYQNEGENRLEVRNDGDSAHLYLHGAVGDSWFDQGGIREEEVLEAINSIPAGRKIHAHINSEGGSVQEGLGIYNIFKARSEDITAHIDGYALSIASVIPLGASKVISPKSAIWMIHKATAGCYGTDDDGEKFTNMMRQHNRTLAEIYSEHTGKSVKNCLDAMAAETWIRGSEAVEYGLADTDDDDGAMDKFVPVPKAVLEKFKHIPANILNALSVRPASHSPTPGQISAAPPAAGNENNTNATIIMDKKELIALLNKWGVKLTGSETEAELKALMEAGKPATQTATNDPEARAQIAALNKARITDKVEAFIGKKLTKDAVTIYVDAALKDEAGTMAIIDKLPDISFGGAAADPNIQVNEPQNPHGLAGKPTPKLIKLAEDCGGDKAKVYAALKKDWDMLFADAKRLDLPRNENTFSSSLTTNFLILGATTQASPKFASVRMFSRDTSVDPYKPLATGQMKFNTTAQDGSTTQTNATNFESGDSTVTNVAITVSQYTEAFHVRNTDLNSGIRMEDLVTAKMASLGSKISKVLAANITAANFATLSPVIRSATSFSFTDMQVLWGQLKKANRKHIMLDGPYLAKLINTATLFQATPVIPGAGWKDIIGWDYLALHTEWSAAGANIIGFACDPQALGVIAGLPLIDSPAIPGGILAQANGMLTGVDLAIAAYSWFNTSTRTYWASFDLMFGANALDTTIGNVIASGTPT